jgi:ABC-type branched-subunit amino acid transport system ATPase component
MNFPIGNTRHYGYVIERGAVVLEGRAQELAKNPLVVTSYLGLARDSTTDSAAS